MKIIHCSDLHLDSPMSSNLSAAKALERNAELCAAFGRLVAYAVREHVTAVLIAGDLFDSPNASRRTVDYVLEKISSAAQVQFFYLRGNHDGDRDAFSGCKIPENLKCFGDFWKSYPCGSVLITGMELGWEKPEACFDDLNLPADACNIVMLHGEIAAQPGPEQIPLPSLRNRNIDYLALGHIHSFRQGKLDDRGIFCYSGCLEGRGFDECGEKGFVLLETRESGIRSTFVPFNTRTLHEIPVDITGLETAPQMLSAMEQVSAGIGEENLVKFVLTGSHTLQTHKDLRFLQKMMEPNFWFVKIKDESHLKLDRESYEGDISLKGEFIRLVLASQHSDEEKERIISCGIRALMGEEVYL